ncbi:MAG: amidase family protein [Deferribacterota bacterium]|nr:amidase family protein [Deferribacterota bacterium]
MLSFEEYISLDATALADLVKKKEVSPTELVEISIKRLEEINPTINAVISKTYEYARERAKKLTSQNLSNKAFPGVPFLIKDILHPLAGVPLTMGSKSLKDYIPEKDSELIKRYKNTGLIIIGKTNVPEFGLLAITEPELFGPTKNPWNTKHSPGGSSGGSAAAIAGGVTPIAHGNDGGGSIRIPSSYCGLFGLKPSRGRLPTGPDNGEIWQGAVNDHILARSVRDSALMLDSTLGEDPGAPYIIEKPEKPYIEEIKIDPGRLRIAFNTESPIGTNVNEEHKNAIFKTAKILEKLGHYVEEDKPEIDGWKLAKSYLCLYFGEVNASIKEISLIRERKVKSSEIESLTRVLYEMGRALTAGEFVISKKYWNCAARIMGKFHEKYDIYLTPTVAFPPPLIGELLPNKIEKLLFALVHRCRLGKLIKSTKIIDTIAKESLERTPFTQLANLTGQPAMNVPLFLDKNGLPIGVHFMTKNGSENILFRLAAQLEKERPWFDKIPKLIK